MFDGYIITPKAGEAQVHKINKRPLFCYYGTDPNYSIIGSYKFAQYDTNCNQHIARLKSTDGKEKISYFQRFGTLPQRELKNFTPVIVSSKNALMTKFDNIPLCPKCFPNGELTK